MEFAQLRGWSGRGRGGYAMLLSLLIVVVIGMIMYFMSMYGPVYQIGTGKSKINPPWRQWHKLYVRLQRGPLGRPSAEQPQLAKPLQVEAKAMQDSDERGDLLLIISPDGTVQGDWKGEFYISKDVDFQIMTCGFKGSIDPKEIYSEGGSKDTSRLFFITKGHFMILETDSKSGRVRNLQGDAYVRGWTGVDNAVSGEIIITSDEKNFYRYTWQGQAKEEESLLFKSFK